VSVTGSALTDETVSGSGSVSTQQTGSGTEAATAAQTEQQQQTGTVVLGEVVTGAGGQMVSSSRAAFLHPQAAKRRARRSRPMGGQMASRKQR
jgi:hypothetical protein